MGTLLIARASTPTTMCMLKLPRSWRGKISQFAATGWSFGVISDGFDARKLHETE
jgi:hypothetical protein